jgi:hypothetical protein
MLVVSVVATTLHAPVRALLHPPPSAVRSHDGGCEEEEEEEAPLVDRENSALDSRL